GNAAAMRAAAGFVSPRGGAGSCERAPADHVPRARELEGARVLGDRREEAFATPLVGDLAGAVEQRAVRVGEGGAGALDLSESMERLGVHQSHARFALVDATQIREGRVGL